MVVLKEVVLMNEKKYYFSGISAPKRKGKKISGRTFFVFLAPKKIWVTYVWKIMFPIFEYFIQ